MSGLELEDFTLERVAGALSNPDRIPNLGGPKLKEFL